MTPRLYKAAEVCEASGLQPYVLRSWEKEFPGIGVQKSQDSPRLYRQSDLDQVLRIKQLVFGEGLTLAGARRRLEDEAPRVSDAGESARLERDEVLDTLGADARARIELVRSGLRSILDVLSRSAGAAVLAEMSLNESLGGRRTAAFRPGPSKSADRGRAAASKGRRGGPSGPPKPATGASARKAAGKTAGKTVSGKRKRASA